MPRLSRFGFRDLTPVNQALINAIRADDPVKVKEALDNHANPAVLTRGNNMPLHIACTEAGGAVTRLLIEHGAPIDTPNTVGSRPIHLAISHGRVDNVAELVKGGVPVNRPEGSKDNTLLHIALDYDRGEEAAIFLIRNGADLTAASQNYTPLFQAVSWKRFNAASEMLVKGCSIDIRDPEGKTPLMRAIAQDNVEAVRFLIDANADANAVNNGTTPLQMALRSKGKSRDIILELLRGGADIEKPENDAVRRVRNQPGLKDLFDCAVQLRQNEIAKRFLPFTEGSAVEVAVQKPLRFKKTP